MTQKIQSLWSPDINATAMTPLTILKGQAEALALQTGGVLLAEISSEQIEEGRIALSFDLVAPALRGSRHRIMRVFHSNDLPYPADVEAEVFDKIGYETASSEPEFTRVVKAVFNSSHVLSVAQSLVARANEALNETVSVK